VQLPRHVRRRLRGHPLALRPAEDEDAYCDYRMRMIDGIAALLAQPAHPTGAWCRTARWCPRQPNSIRDVTAFLARWDNADAPHPAVRLHTSAYGSINTVGLPGIHEADDLDPAHPQWHEAIEPGVRSLVEVLTRDWGLVTYDSCEGHSYTETELPPTARRVGLLPRSRSEYAATADALCRAVTACVAEMPAAIVVGVGRAELACESSGRTTSVLDLSLQPAAGHGWPTYFDVVDSATDVLAAHLRRERPITGGRCACSTRQFSGPVSA